MPKTKWKCMCSEGLGPLHNLLCPLHGAKRKTPIAQTDLHPQTQMEPLRIVANGDAAKCHPAIILGHRLRIIIDRSEDFGDPLPTAERILRAVNSFDDLLEAAKGALVRLAEEGYPADGTDFITDALAQAIEKAERKP